MNRSFPATMDELHEMLKFVRGEFNVEGFKGAVLTQMELAVEEAIVNIIKHGYIKKCGDIRIDCIHLIEKPGIKVILVDCGIHYNPLLNIPKDLNVSMDARPIGGYGVHLIKKIMDKVDYEYKDECNVLTLTKYRS